MSEHRYSLLLHPEELDEVWLDAAEKYHIQTLRLHPVGGGSAHRSFEELIRLTDDERFRGLVADAGRRGIAIGYEMHALRYFLPEALFNEHPDWFRMNAEGVRVPDLNCCASSEAALDHIAEAAAAAARKLRFAGNVSHDWFFWLDDARDADCRCERCRRLSPSDQQMTVLNAIVRRLRQDDPAARLAFLAYADCTMPPEKVTPEDGIFLEIAPMARDFHKPLHGGDDPRNAARCEEIERLLKVFPASEAKALDYWLDNSCFSGWKKPPKLLIPDTDVMAADIAWYRQLGIRDISCFACYLGADYRALYGDAPLGTFAEAAGLI